MSDVVGLPAGLKVELCRATLLADRSDEADRWMAMLMLLPEPVREASAAWALSP